jgi:thiamine-phosphate pyrophosphorylase
MTPRLFLVATIAHSETNLLACAAAACSAGDCASILVPAKTPRETIAALQALNLAVLLHDAEPREVHHAKADGLMLSSLENFRDARLALKAEVLGFIAGTSRHEAMEAAESGADVMAFTQTKQYVGEPIIGWWQDVTEVPAFAFDPVNDAGLKLQRPDFIRPEDAMWQNAESAAQVVSELMAKWQA